LGALTIASMILSETPARLRLSRALVLVSKLAGPERTRASTTASLRPPLTMDTMDSLVRVSCATAGVAGPASASRLAASAMARIRGTKSVFFMEFLLRDKSIRSRDKSRARPWTRVEATLTSSRPPC
jgi:hypothetical protein